MPDDPIKPELRNVMNDIAALLQRAIDSAGDRKRYGFCLMIFEFGGGGSMNYIANANREDLMRAMGEWIICADPDPKLSKA